MIDGAFMWDGYAYLANTGGKMLPKYIWKPGALYTHPVFRNGPVEENTYKFRIFILTEDGDPYFYGPFETTTVLFDTF